jgi:hypothetical protein
MLTSADSMIFYEDDIMPNRSRKIFTAVDKRY